MKFLTRKLVTPADLNPRGTLHGGQLLKWIDEEGGIHAALELQTGLIVTKYISEIDFKFPVLEGDVVEIGMQTIEISIVLPNSRETNCPYHHQGNIR